LEKTLAPWAENRGKVANELQEACEFLAKLSEL
jgi:hypothetical protein